MKAGLENMILAARAAIGRHRGILGLLQRAAEIIHSEGLAGVAVRLRFHATVRAGATPEERGSFEVAGTCLPDLGLNGETAGAEPFQRSRAKIPSGLSALRPGLLPGAVLVGHPYGVLGMGEVVRSSANAFESVGLPFSIRNTFGEYGKQDAVHHKDFKMMDRITTAGLYKTNIFYLNADEMENARAALGSDFFRGRYNIACWAWELSRFPDAWCDAFDLVDEIWAMSRFTQQAIAEKASCPVLWMPLAVELTDSIRLSRKYFGLPENKFLFLFFFDFRSYIKRKNPEAVVHAFQKAFGNRQADDVCMVIKVNGTDVRNDAYRTFREWLTTLECPAILLDNVMDDREIKELLRVCDCFVSLHRSEGFGRGLAEAMYLEKPVIATGYSGNLDFTNEINACLVDHVLIPVKRGEYPFGEGQFWAEPDVEQAAWFMQRLVDMPSFAEAKGRLGQQYIKTHHSFRAVGERKKRRLANLGLI